MAAAARDPRRLLRRAFWPNCARGLGIPSRRSPGNPLPLPSARFVVCGRTNGPGWCPNPCLAEQVAWAKSAGVWTSAYSMTTFPTPSQQAVYGGGPWSPSTQVGRLRNAGYQQALFNVASMAAAGLAVPFGWVDIEPYPSHPWPRDVLANREVARGAVVAAARCEQPSFSGGQVLLGQWVQDSRDRDVTCPAVTGRAEAPHPLSALLGASLAPGAVGPAVRTLQQGMNMRPEYQPGIFDARTSRVLLAFQASRSLPLTGVATDVELAALGAGTTVPGLANRMAEHFTAY